MSSGEWLRAVEPGEELPQDARINPLVMFRRIVEGIESGDLQVGRTVVVIETEAGVLDVRGSGWHGDDTTPAIALLEVGKMSLVADALVRDAE